MKRKYADRLGWARITEKRYKQLYLEESTFTGYVAALFLDKVKAPLVVKYEQHERCIVDNGYVWLQHFPAGEHYTLTTMYDSSGKVVQWYFDMTKSHGLTEQGVPYMEDLYLDVVVLTNGDIFVLDEDELQQALDAGVIDEHDFELAKRTAAKLVDTIQAGEHPLIVQADKHYAMFTE